MKLYNKTRCPDVLLTDLLVRAGRSVGSVRTSGVVVKVTQARTNRCSGVARECGWVYEWHLRKLPGRGKRKNPKGRSIDTDGGYFSITLPRMRDPLTAAETFFSVAVHEWGHIRDYQHGGTRRLDWSVSRKGLRRANHDVRPEEKRANHYAHEATQRIESGKVQSSDDAILALALWIEQQTD